MVLKCLDSRHWHSMILDLNIVYNVGLKIKDTSKIKSSSKVAPSFAASQLFKFQKLDNHLFVAKVMTLQAKRKTIPQMLQKRKNGSRLQVVRPGIVFGI